MMFAAPAYIIERDINVNRMDIDLEEMCMQLLALHQPVAGDLRLITAVMKITTRTGANRRPGGQHLRGCSRSRRARSGNLPC